MPCCQDHFNLASYSLTTIGELDTVVPDASKALLLLFKIYFQKSYSPGEHSVGIWMPVYSKGHQLIHPVTKSFAGICLQTKTEKKTNNSLFWTMFVLFGVANLGAVTGKIKMQADNLTKDSCNSKCLWSLWFFLQWQHHSCARSGQVQTTFHESGRDAGDWKLHCRSPGQQCLGRPVQGTAWPECRLNQRIFSSYYFFESSGRQI